MTTEQVDATSEIRANVAAFERNVRAQDASGVAEAFYAEDGMVMPPDQPVVRGRARIAEFWQGMFNAGLREAALTIEQLEASGDIAYEIGRFELQVGEAKPTGKYVVVHRRQANGKWRAIADMFSFNGAG